jgi:hypothetical protein
VNVVVPKPAKKDKAAPKSYRPVALLECMSKLLEKMVNARMQHDCGNLGLVPTNQFGCRAKSSTLDAGLTLTHDIETAWSHGFAASVLTFDISGNFDRVRHDWLCRIVEKMGFAPGLVWWLALWLSGRQIQFRLDGSMTPERVCSVGIPQGSPLSPILSAIYTAWIADTLKGRGGCSLLMYVDNGALSAFGPTLESNVLVLQQTFSLAVKRLQDVGMPVDKGKCDLMHFTRRRNMGSPAARPVMPDGTQLHVTARDTMRWLGFYFDRTLSWNQHVRIMCNRAASKITAMRILGNPVSGMCLVNHRRLFNSVVIPTLTYGAPLWFKGKGKRQDSLVGKMQQVQNRGLRLMLGAFKTSRVEPMEHIAAIPPVWVRLERLANRAAARLRSLPKQSQPILRLPASWGMETEKDCLPIRPAVRRPRTDEGRQKAALPHTQLHQLAARADVKGDKDERVIPFLAPPWERDLRDKFANGRYRVIRGNMKDREEAADAVRQEVQAATADPSTPVIFTDGSRHKVRTLTTVPRERPVRLKVGRGQHIRLGRPADGRIRLRAEQKMRTGAGYVVYRAGQEVAAGGLGLGEKSDNYNGELCALAAVARRAKELSADDNTIMQWKFYSDNSAAVEAIGDRGDHAGQVFSSSFCSSVNHFLSTRQSHLITVSWTPGHMGIHQDFMQCSNCSNSLLLRVW